MKAEKELVIYSHINSIDMPDTEKMNIYYYGPTAIERPLKLQSRTHYSDSENHIMHFSWICIASISAAVEQQRQSEPGECRDDGRQEHVLKVSLEAV